MNIGFIGAGKAGCSIGKYFSEYGFAADLITAGYFSLIKDEAKWAATFTDSMYFTSISEVIAQSDAIIISTPDGVIKEIWDAMPKNEIKGKIICHLSGSLSFDVFSNVEQYGATAVSLHPLFAFSNKDSVYKQLKDVCFTLEGDANAVMIWKSKLSSMGNQCVVIGNNQKAKYHAAASIISNHVVAVLATGYELLVECGFSEEEARIYSRCLVLNNVEHVIEMGAVDALTGPIERGDFDTVTKHLSVLNQEQIDLYKCCGKKLTEISQKKNDNRNYDDILKLFS